MLYLCVIVFIIVYIIIYPVLSLEPEMLGKDQQIHSSFLYTYMKTRFNFFLCFLFFFNFFKITIFKWTCFKFYLITVSICCLYFIMYRGAHNVFGPL